MGGGSDTKLLTDESKGESVKLKNQSTKNNGGESSINQWVMLPSLDKFPGGLNRLQQLNLVAKQKGNQISITGFKKREEAQLIIQFFRDQKISPQNVIDNLE